MKKLLLVFGLVLGAYFVGSYGRQSISQVGAQVNPTNMVTTKVTDITQVNRKNETEMEVTFEVYVNGSLESTQKMYMADGASDEDIKKSLAYYSQAHELDVKETQIKTKTKADKLQDAKGLIGKTF